MEQLSTRLPRSKRLLAKMGLMVEEEESHQEVLNSSIKCSTWSELPPELLESVAGLLELEELLGFRSVCKNWRSATSNIVDRTNSIDDQNPWFLLYGNNSSSCQLHNTLTDKLHTIHIPELAEDSYCIASGQGWILLLYRDGSVFFFCPFSRAKIHLPRFLHGEEGEGELSNHYVGAFTSVPAASDCTVWIISQCHTNKKSFKVRVLRRGDDKWTEYEYIHSYDQRLIMSATISNGTLYFLDSTDQVVTFSPTKVKQWKDYIIVENLAPELVHHRLPFSNYRTYLSEKLKQTLGLDDGDSVSICGTVLHMGSQTTCIHNQDIKAEEGKELRRTKGVWIQPLFQLPSNQSWSL